MGKLEELREQLYRRKGEGREGTRPEGERSFRRKRKAETLPHEWPGVRPRERTLIERVALRELGGARRRRRTLVIVGGLLALLAAAGTVGYFLYPSARQVEFEIVGPRSAEAGAVATVLVSIRNKGTVPLRPGSLTITYGPGVVPVGTGELGFTASREKVSLEAVRPGQELREELRVRLFGRPDESRSISATYVYRPENVASDLLKKAEFTLSVSRVPVAITVDVPEAVNAGEPFNLEVVLDSESSTPLEATALRIDFPQGFELLSAEPVASEPPSLWGIGDLTPGETRRIRLRGKLSGEPEEPKVFAARLGRYRREGQEWLPLAEATRASHIASPFLFVRTSLGGRRDGAIAPGERIEGEVLYKNSLDQKLENLVVTLSFPEILVELETLSAPGGFYDVTKRRLVWNAASQPSLRELAPGEEGTIRFSFTVRSAPPLRTFADKNFTFPVLTTISQAVEVPEFRGLDLTYQDRITLKISTRLTLAARATYYDSPFKNSGPLPPRVRSETSYTIRFELVNTSNDLSEVEVRALLGGGVTWLGVLERSTGALTYNEATGEIVWKIPQLPAATGILRPSAQAAFQLAITPAENQIGAAPALVTAIAATGRDTFSGQEVRTDVRDPTTELSSDPRSNPNEWRVVR